MSDNLESGRIETIRPYVFDYVTGVLWLLAASAALVNEQHLQNLATSVDNIAAKMSHATIPSFVIGFGLVIGGIVFPYCLNIIAKMPTLRLMNVFLQLQRKQDDSDEAKYAARIQESAMSTIQHAAGISGYVSSNFALLYLETLQPKTASALRATRLEIDFKAASALPVALVAGFAAGRVASLWLLPYVAVVVGVGVGAASFVTAVWSTNQALDNTYEDLAVALLVAEARRTSLSDQTLTQSRPLTVPSEVPAASEKVTTLPKGTA